MSRSTDQIHVLCVARHPIGGIRSYIRYIYGRLDPARYRFRVVMARGPGDDYLAPEDLSGFETDFRIVQAGKWVSVRLALAVRRALGRSTIDLIHAHGLTAGLAVLAASPLGRSPAIVTSHETLQAGQFSSIGGPIKRWALAAMVRRFDTIHFVSDDAARNFLEYVPAVERFAGKYRVVPHGIDVESFRSPPGGGGGLRDRLGLPKDLPVISFFGRFMPAKGFDLLVDAVDIIRRRSGAPPSLRVLAANDGAYVREYRQEIRDRGLDSWFTFVGFSQNIVDVLGAADAVVMPSRHEAAGLVAMEALVAGTPLIASDCIGLRETIADTPTAVVPTEDAAALADAICRFLADRDRAKIAAAEYAAVARERFDSRRAADELDKLFSQLVTPGASAG